MTRRDFMETIGFEFDKVKREWLKSFWWGYILIADKMVSQPGFFTMLQEMIVNAELRAMK